MKKALLVILIILVITTSLALCACTGYKSSFKATMLVCTNLSKEASMNFDSITGTKVFNMNWKDDTEGTIEYTGTLDKGKLTVYYDGGDGKQELFTLKEGETVSEKAGKIQKGKVYIIVETDGKCEGGKLSFNLV